MSVGLIYRYPNDHGPIIFGRVGRLPRRPSITPNGPGPTIRVRILRDCGRWTAGQTGTINADYARELFANGLAEEVKTNRR